LDTVSEYVVFFEGDEMLLMPLNILYFEKLAVKLLLNNHYFYINFI
jgi:hypothetical protein